MYLCIDLKSFYASVECSERGLDPFAVNLVVADPTRGNGALCMAITPKMKTLGVKNRCRIFEIPQGMDYIVAKPRMRLYMEYAARIYKIFLNYVAKEDIHVYSIDESFLNIEPYMKLYGLSPKALAKKITDAIFEQTHITATVGIGTNLYLTKVALDILSKHVPDNMGYLDEGLYQNMLWHHKPLTDFWRIGPGLSRRLASLGIFDMYDLAHYPESILYQVFGIQAEYLIDHAWGKEPTTIQDIKAYHSQAHSISNSQILFEDYSYQDAYLIVKEMVDVNVLRLVDEHLVTNRIALYVGYSKNCRKASSATTKITNCTNSYRILLAEFKRLYQRIVDPHYPIRQIGLSFCDVKDERYESYDLFTNPNAIEKEASVQKAIIEIKQKYGKNAILKGMNLEEKATARKRNLLIGGHNAQ
ncbi:MAG: DNA repair protein [Absicoccus sp.]|uniref:Y-family DNA polymerase n=1 Tax=Absicoccus sp. TaxID=2718527 RepID=UPI002A754308|nr:DNA repair protein [Absicoccus sp.]MDY3036547.1 DNA repair protein [Absicoccus sp.]